MESGNLKTVNHFWQFDTRYWFQKLNSSDKGFRRKPKKFCVNRENL
jgi:hypothetical protein